MFGIEQLVIQLLLKFVSVDTLNAFLSDPRAVAIVIGALVAISAAWLGVFLLLRKMSLTSDAISHTVLLGIVVAFLFMVAVLGLEPDFSSPLLILGAAGAGVATVVLTELIYKSGLVKADAALGLAFPLLFAVSIILISRFADNVHLDTDMVLVGEVGLAWANTNSHCLENCEDVVITADDPRAEVGSECANCQSLGISPRSPDAIFVTTCVNCGTFTAAEAWRERLIAEPPILVYWPKSLTTMTLITLVNIAFVLLFYKELKLASFDAGLAGALGFRPGWIHYVLMILVSVTAVGAFDAVGSILVVAFFIIPAAAAYLLTDKLSMMLVIAPLIGSLSAYTGYDLARGQLFGVVDMSAILAFIDRHIFSLGGYTTWNTSISASMVIMAFILFVLTWVLSPRYGLISTLVRRRSQRDSFATQMLLGHVFNHQNSESATRELALSTLHEHLNWSRARLTRVLTEARIRNLVRVEDNRVSLTERGERQMHEFITEKLGVT